VIVGKILYAFAGMLIGILLIDYSFISVVCEITVGEIVTLLCTVLLAFLVSKWWRDSQVQDDSFRNYLDQLTDEIRTEIPDLRNAFSSVIASEESVYSFLVPRFRHISNVAYEIDLISESKCGTKLTSGFMKALLALKKYSTDQDAGSSVEKKSLEEFDCLITTLRREITMLKLSVYRS